MRAAVPGSASVRAAAVRAGAVPESVQFHAQPHQFIKEIMSHFVALPWVMETGSLPPLAGAGGDGLRLFAVSAGRGGARGVHGGGGCRRS